MQFLWWFWCCSPIKIEVAPQRLMLTFNANLCYLIFWLESSTKKKTLGIASKFYPSYINYYKILFLIWRFVLMFYLLLGSYSLSITLEVNYWICLTGIYYVFYALLHFFWDLYVFAALSGDMSKLLLAAKKIRRATCTEFIISLVADDFSRACDTYVGKLRLVLHLSSPYL